MFHQFFVRFVFALACIFTFVACSPFKDLPIYFPCTFDCDDAGMDDVPDDASGNNLVDNDTGRVPADEEGDNNVSNNLNNQNSDVGEDVPPDGPDDVPPDTEDTCVCEEAGDDAEDMEVVDESDAEGDEPDADGPDAEEDVCVATDEACNNADDDCDGQVDEGLVYQIFYADADGDGYGNAEVSIESCLEAIGGYVLNDTDCDDTSNVAHPGGFEVTIDTSGQGPVFIDHCHDGFDNDCDGQVDEGDFDCLDRDDDSVPNGVDPIYTQDQDANGQLDTICVVAAMVMPEPWSGHDVFRQGSTPTWGAYMQVYTEDRLRLRTINENGSWCYNMSLDGSAVSRRFRFVSSLNANEVDLPNQDACETWKIADLSVYCGLFSAVDPFCYTETAPGSPCDNGTPGFVLGGRYTSGMLGPF